MAAPKPVPTSRIVAASADLKIGQVLNASNLTTIDVSGPLPKGAIIKPEQAIGRGVTAAIIQGEPILESRLAAPGSGGGLAATIPNGMRACAIKVDEVVGVAGFVTPGMRVDVLISGTPPGSNNQAAQDLGTISRTILQNIQVLSAGTDIQKDAEGKPQQVQVVNLLVTPDQAETLNLASNQTVKIQLVLRNPLDTTVVKVPGTAMKSLFGDDTPTAPASQHPAYHPVRKPPKTYTVEVINGSTTTATKFPTPSEGKQ